MTTYLIGFDLNKEGSAYRETNERLSEAIRELATGWWHHLDSTWIIVTTLTAAEIRDALRAFLDKDDELLVLKSGFEAAWSGFSPNGSSWLKNNL